MSTGFPRVSSTLQEVEIISTLAIFHSRGCLVEFECPKGLFGKIMGYGNSALF